MTLKLCCKNDFVEQITIIYWLFYALLNNQQFMKTTCHRYCHKYSGSWVGTIRICSNRESFDSSFSSSSLAVCPALGLGSHVASHPGMSSGTQDPIYKVLWKSSGEGNAPHSSTLAWKIPWTEEPGRLQSMGSLRVGRDWVTSLSLFTFKHWRRKWQPTPGFLPGESQGEGSLVGCRLWGRTELDTTEAT